MQYMFLRVVRAYREDGKAKHEVLFNLGRLDQLENNPEFAKVFKKLAAIAGAKSINIEECSEAQIIRASIWWITTQKARLIHPTFFFLFP